MRVELRTRPAWALVVADETPAARAERWAVRCECGFDAYSEQEEAADEVAAAHRAACPLREGALVGRATLPRFDEAPSCVVFGQRIFLPRAVGAEDEAGRRLRGDPLLVYEEAKFTYAVAKLEEAAE